MSQVPEVDPVWHWIRQEDLPRGESNQRESWIYYLQYKSYG